jgi:hypothetical protein
MSDEHKFKHDVAFSFLAPDLTLATQFADALAPLTSFVYSRKQEVLAGTDGQESFRAAFRFESRLNVVLLRAGWGETPWTRVEQAAIQERCLKDGWEHLLVVNLDGSAPPKWMPAVNLYLDLRTFPFEQAVGAIKRQAQQLGSDIRPQTHTDKARIKLSQADFDAETKVVFRTPDGIKLADAAVVRASNHLKAELQKLSDEGNRNWNVVAGRDNATHTVVRVQGVSALFNWQRYANDCSESDLHVDIFAAGFETPDEMRAGKRFMRFGRESRPVYERVYRVARHPALGIVWKSGAEVLTSEDVAGRTLQTLIELLTRNR